MFLESHIIFLKRTLGCINSHVDGRMEVLPLIMVSMKEIWLNNRKARDYILGFRFYAPLCWKGKHQHSHTELRLGLKANTEA